MEALSPSQASLCQGREVGGDQTGLTEELWRSPPGTSDVVSLSSKLNQQSVLAVQRQVHRVPSPALRHSSAAAASG